MKKIRVLQFICPVGFYGAERWVLALVNNTDINQVEYDLAVTEESDNQDLEIVNQFPSGHGLTHKIKLNSRFDLSAVNKLVKIIKDREISIIHTHGYKSDILGLLAAKVAGIKCVATPHGFGTPSSFKLRMFIRLGAFFLRFFDKVVPLSEQLFDEVREFGVPQRKIAYIKNGVDLSEVDEFRAHNPRSADSNVKKIGFIGQMVPRKNIQDILDVFEELYKILPDIELVLLGDGESRTELENRSRSLNSASQIKFLGFLNDRLSYLNQFDVFIMTSRDEGIPRCLMEALAMEIPVAAYDIKGVDLLVEHDKTGLLAKFGDKEKMLSNCRILLQDEAQAARLSSAGRAYVDENFSAKRMAREYCELFSTFDEVK